MILSLFADWLRVLMKDLGRYHLPIGNRAKSGQSRPGFSAVIAGMIEGQLYRSAAGSRRSLNGPLPAVAHELCERQLSERS